MTSSADRSIVRSLVPPIRDSPRGSVGSEDALLRYGVAVVAAAGGLALRRALSALWGGELPYLTLYPAVLGSVWYGGIGPGVPDATGATAAKGVV